MRISVEIVDDEKVEINANEQGLEYLINALTQLKKNGDHVHMMTEAWGMWQLNEQTSHTDSKLVQHLEIIRNES